MHVYFAVVHVSFTVQFYACIRVYYCKPHYSIRLQCDVLIYKCFYSLISSFCMYTSLSICTWRPSSTACFHSEYNYIVTIIFCVCVRLFLQLNTFQLVLATNTRQSYAMFLYQSVTWTYGRASRGRHARAGLNAGDGRRQVTVPYSGSSAMSSIEGRSNIQRQRGLYIYRTSGSTVPTRRKWCKPTTLVWYYHNVCIRTCMHFFFSLLNREPL